MQAAISRRTPESATGSATHPGRAQGDRDQLEKRIGELRAAVANLARAGERAYIATHAGAPRAPTLRGQMNALSAERELLEAQLEARYPDAARADARFGLSTHVELTRYAGVMRDRRAAFMLDYAQCLALYTPPQGTNGHRATALSTFMIAHANERSPHPASQFWTEHHLEHREGFVALIDSDRIKLCKLADLASDFRAADRTLQVALQPLHRPERAALSLQQFTRAYNTAHQRIRIDFVDFLCRNLPQRPQDHAVMIEDMSELNGREALPQELRPLLEDFFLLPPAVRDSHYTVLVALTGKVFKLLEDVAQMEAESGESPTPEEERAIARGNADIEALLRALSVHAPQVSAASDFDEATAALDSFRGDLVRLQDVTDGDASSARDVFRASSGSGGSE